MFTAKVLINPSDDLRGGEQAGRFDNGPPPLHPVWFKRIQPRTFDRQAPGQQAYPAVSRGLLIMCTDPRADLLTDIPEGIVPQQHQDPFPLGGQPRSRVGHARKAIVTCGKASDNP
jgi:hypothetical protein